MSRTAKIIKTRNAICSSWVAYARVAYDWDPPAEGDYDAIKDDVDEHLEAFAENLRKHSHD